MDAVSTVFTNFTETIMPLVYLHLKFCIIIASSFFGVLQSSKEKSKTLVRYILEISPLQFRDVFSDGGGEVKRNNAVFSIPGLKPVKK